MKILRLYIVFLLVSFTSVAFAVTLPSQSFFGANELYEENEDVVEISVGTRIGGINLRLSSENEAWGTQCYKGGHAEQGECQDCCDASWAAEGYTDAGEELYDTCIKMCGGGPSLPLGSTLWLLPFILGYGIYKKVRTSKSGTSTGSVTDLA